MTNQHGQTVPDSLSPIDRATNRAGPNSTLKLFRTIGVVLLFLVTTTGAAADEAGSTDGNEEAATFTAAFDDDEAAVYANWTWALNTSLFREKVENNSLVSIPLGNFSAVFLDLHEVNLFASGTPSVTVLDVNFTPTFSYPINIWTYQRRVLGDNASRVVLTMDDGGILGTITAWNTTFHVNTHENSSRMIGVEPKLITTTLMLGPDIPYPCAVTHTPYGNPNPVCENFIGNWIIELAVDTANDAIDEADETRDWLLQDVVWPLRDDVVDIVEWCLNGPGCETPFDPEDELWNLVAQIQGEIDDAEETVMGMVGFVGEQVPDDPPEPPDEDPPACGEVNYYEFGQSGSGNSIALVWAIAEAGFADSYANWETRIASAFNEQYQMWYDELDYGIALEICWTQDFGSSMDCSNRIDNVTSNFYPPAGPKYPEVDAYQVYSAANLTVEPHGDVLGCAGNGSFECDGGAGYDWGNPVSVVEGLDHNPGGYDPANSIHLGLVSAHELSHGWGAGHSNDTNENKYSVNAAGKSASNQSFWIADDCAEEISNTIGGTLWY